MKKTDQGAISKTKPKYEVYYKTMQDRNFFGRIFQQDEKCSKLFLRQQGLSQNKKIPVKSEQDFQLLSEQFCTYRGSIY